MRGVVEIIPLQLPELEAPDDPESTTSAAGPSWRDPRLNDMPLPNRLLPPERFAYGSRKGRAEYEARQMVAAGRLSSMHGVHGKVVPPTNSLFSSRQPRHQAAVARREAAREEADALSQLFDAQASERAFSAAFALLQAARVECEACAAIDGIQAVCRVPPNLLLIDAAAALQLLGKLRMPFERLTRPPRCYLRKRAALASQLEAEIARRQSALPPRAVGPRTEMDEILHGLSTAKAAHKLRRRIGADELVRRRIGTGGAALRFKGRRPELSAAQPWRPPHLQLLQLPQLPQLRVGDNGSPRKAGRVPSLTHHYAPLEPIDSIVASGRVSPTQRSSLTAKSLPSRTKPRTLNPVSPRRLRVGFL